MVTDRGSLFDSELFRDLSAILGFHRLRTTAYHPQTNRIIQCLLCNLKTAIATRKQSCLDTLPTILFGIRNMPNDSGFFPDTAVTRTQLLLLRSIIDRELSQSEQRKHKIRRLDARVEYNPPFWKTITYNSKILHTKRVKILNISTTSKTTGSSILRQT